MILSRKHGYLFIEVPNTASTAIAAELCEHYDGEAILWKHACYHEFISAGGSSELAPYVFAGVRDPMDAVLSRYFKMKTDHRHQLSTMRNRRGRRSGRRLRKFEAVFHEGVPFADYFARFHRHVFNDLTCLLPATVARMMRFERVDQDFAAALDDLSLDMRRPLPARNITSKDDASVVDMFSTCSPRQVAMHFGPYMSRWDYPPPTELALPAYPAYANVLFRMDTALRRIYYERIHAARIRRSLAAGRHNGLTLYPGAEHYA